ncbi:MAG: hypothetical protein ACYCYE_17310 [Clostridia bacterium]
MKRLILIVITVLMMLSGMLNCFSAAADSIGILSDLTLLDQLESQQLMANIEYHSRELEYQYNEGIRITRTLDGYGKPTSAKNQTVKTHQLLYALGYKGRSIDDNSLLFRDDIFIDYYRMRTGSVLEEYKKSGRMDLSAFIGRAKQEFDIFLKEVQKDNSRKNRINLLLQDKLLDKMYSDDLDNKSGYFEKVLALRLVSNTDKRNQSLYELMESRVRLKLLQELVDINRDTMEAYLDELKVIINMDYRYALSNEVSSLKNTLYKVFFSVYM